MILAGYLLFPISSIEPNHSGKENFKGGCLLPVVGYLSDLGVGFWYLESDW